MMQVALLGAAVTVVSCVLTGLVRRYALTRELVDVPNDRSSHTVATPRGGGLAIVVTIVAALLGCAAAGWLPAMPTQAMVAAGIIVAAVGFVDDHGHLAARWRLAVHLTGAAIVLAAFGGLPPIVAFGTSIDPGWLAWPAGMLYIAWIINLTNFMDGIDGIAAIETITAALGGALVYRIAAPGAPEWIGPLLLAAAAAGFLVWNWPPAKIFMGDVGSGFVGMLLAALSVQAAWVDARLLWAWIVLLAAFVVDATVTLARRALAGEPVHQAHRTHAYQHAAMRLGHTRVTLAVGAINVIWLWPMAVLAATGRLDGATAATVAYVPLIALVLGLKAGVRVTSHAATRAGHV